MREPSATLADCELSFLRRRPIDPSRARAQHAGYGEALRTAGAEVVVLPPADPLPDAAFVEDTVVVVDEVAVLCAIGVASRAPEVELMASDIEPYRPVRRLPPGTATLEGGDVLRVGRTLYVGRSTRTNEHGITALRTVLEPFGYRVRTVAVNGCLHLKTACTSAADGVVLLNPAWVDPAIFEADGLEVLVVAPSEPYAGNVLRVGETLLVSAGYPETERRLQERGLQPVPVEIGELQKAEAGLSCLSVLVQGGAALPTAPQ